MENITINYFAVIVAAIVNFVIGALWHGPLFGKQWMALSSFTPESMRSMKMKPKTAMILGFLSLLVTAYVLAHFVAIVNAQGLMGALQLAFWIWLGFIAMIILGSVLWEGKSVNLYLFNIVYQFVGLFAMALVLVFWR